MPFDYGKKFGQAQSYEGFLSQHGSESDRQAWQQVYDRISLTGEQSSRLGLFRRQMKVLVMAGAWCGDCVAQCPIFQRFAEVSSNIEVRYIDSRTDLELAGELQLCGAPRVPQVIFLAEDDAVIGRYGDRTLSRYVAMEAANQGSEPLNPKQGELLEKVVADWLDEFYRCQLILQTSPRLRRKHGE